ncbi:hypothetical protein [Pseudoroseicyclus sp. CXY001]|uniref:hypothetical protein n=1 Tax=Pseudoroseicyclus sp. CXY001 TaxID=3242492 RepID=UPI003570A8A0
MDGRQALRSQRLGYAIRQTESHAHLNDGKILKPVEDQGGVNLSARDQLVAVIAILQVQMIGPDRFPKRDVAQRLQPLFDVLNVLKYNHEIRIPKQPYRKQILAHRRRIDVSDFIDRELSKVFHEAVLRFEERQVRKPEDWQDLRDIKERFADAREKMIGRYHEEYHARVDTQRAELLNRHADFTPSSPRPAGSGTSAKDITREAHAIVKQAHERDLRGLEASERGEIEALITRAHERDQVDGMARKAFAQVSERRSGGDRRAPKQSIL